MKMSDRVIDSKKINAFIFKVLAKAGVNKADSKIVANSLVEGELYGFYSHGVMRLAHYLKRVKAGTIKKNPKIKIEKKNGCTSLVDGGHGFGHAISMTAVKQAIKLAGKFGVGMVGVKNSSHFGMAGVIALEAVKKDMICIAISHTDASVVPFGGRIPAIGTNPICVAVPCNKKYPVLLDMATSVASLGKIIVARKKGEPIPSDWGVDEEGVPTTDANKIKYLLPMAGPKGYGLAFIVDILCGPLTGALFGIRLPKMYGDYDKFRMLGHMFIVINIKNFVPLKEFKKNVALMVDDIHSIPPAKGFSSVMVPGEREFASYEKNIKNGFSLAEETYADLESIAKEYGVALEIEKQ